MSLILLNGGFTSALFTQAEVDLTAIDIVNDTTPQLGGDLDCEGNSLTDIYTMNLNNVHPAGRNTEIRSVGATGQGSGAGGLVITTVNSGQDGRPSRIFLQQKNNGGTELGGVEQRFTYHSTEANKSFKTIVYSDDYSSNKVAYQVNGLGDETILVSDTIRLRKADNTDLLTVKDNSSAVGGADATLRGAITVGPEGLSTETDLSVFQLKPDYGSNTIPDGADVKLNFQVRNDADGAVTLGKFSAVYDATASNRKFRMESPDGSNAMNFFDSHTEFTAPIQAQALTTTERDALSPSNGWIIYNETNNRFEFYHNGGWVYYTANSA